MYPMKQEAPYPRIKVFVLFSFCPAIGGIIVFFFVVVSPLFSGQIDAIKPIISDLFSTLKVVFLFAIVGQFICCIPAIILAWLYSYLRLYKSLKSILFVSLMGGLGATGFAIAYKIFTQNDYGELFSERGFYLGAIYIFLLGAISSFLVGLLVLPKRLKELEKGQSTYEFVNPNVKHHRGATENPYAAPATNIWTSEAPSGGPKFPTQSVAE